MPTVKTVAYPLSSRWDLICAARTPPEVLVHGHHSVERKIAAADARIDRLVNDLYGVLEDEITTVQDAAK